ncbi:MAG: hypothetical protein C0190_01575 [Thermodesulfobacterium geofontis]|uniref:Uncharacterized protein n=1 Tax=Thermodesulfobacterium geofontis TaxID=1295609 RepID=A0A2N7PPT5_9BACT|nr:MAG: hypothetical protein C0190_01575 [Thermodesulfobacterium geofontis]
MSKIQTFKLASPRSAVFKLKRWFYATFANREIPQEVREENIKKWKAVAAKVVEELGKRELKPEEYVRINITYEEGENKNFIPQEMLIEILKVKKVEEIKILDFEIPEKEISEEILEEKSKEAEIEE